MSDARAVEEAKNTERFNTTRFACCRFLLGCEAGLSILTA